MGENSKIEWCDHTFNPWRGCTKVSPGCAHCYAETLSKRNPAVLGQWGPGKPRVLASEAAWKEPLRWHVSAGTAGLWPRVFCASLADWLDEEVPVAWLVRLLDLIDRTLQLDWLLLTKRPGNWRGRMEAAREAGCKLAAEWLDGHARRNVWVGTTVEDQPRADERIPLLLKIPADVHFLSCEPLLGPLDLEPFLGRSDYVKRCPLCLYFTNRGSEDVCPNDGAKLTADIGIDWVICGGESGPGARPMHPDWARGLRDRCVESNVAFFFKQWGEFRPASPTDFDDAKALIGWVQIDGGTHQQDVPMHDADELMVKAGKKVAGRVLDGLTWNESPRYEVK